MNTGTMSRHVATVIKCWKTYAALAFVGLVASFSGAAAAQAGDPEVENKFEIVEKESPEESVHMLIQDRFRHFRSCRLQLPYICGWEPVRKCIEREPRVAKLLDLARNGSERQRASLLAEVKKMCRYFIEELRMVSDSPDELLLPSVRSPAGALAYPLLLSVLDDKAETLPLLLAMRARHQEARRKWHPGTSEKHEGIGDEKAEQSGEVADLFEFGQVLAYACVELLGKYERVPALRSALSTRQAHILADFAAFDSEFNNQVSPTDGLRPRAFAFNTTENFRIAHDFVQAADK